MCDDAFGGGTNPSDVSINTANSKKVTMGSHIMEQHTFKYQEYVQPELLSMTSYKLHKNYLPHNYESDFLDSSKDRNIILKANDVTNNMANTQAIGTLNQENQHYWDRQDQQYIGSKYNGGLE